MTQRRGAFIVLEGLDRSGKSTQVQRLYDRMVRQGKKVSMCRFPDRTTPIGTMINSYLTSTTTSSSDLDDRSIHLLFSANRWERSKNILKDLEAGTTVICDRYAFSGIAFTTIKGIPYTWCKSPDVGLPLPDLVLFLDLSPEVAAQRGGYGTERYEKESIQLAVREVFKKIGGEKSLEGVWKVVDAGVGVEEVEKRIGEVMEEVIGDRILGEVGKLWE